MIFFDDSEGWIKSKLKKGVVIISNYQEPNDFSWMEVKLED